MDSSASGTIRIERTHQFANRIRSITIWLNGERVGRVRDGAVADFAVAPGPHEIRATIDWCSTETVAVRVLPGGQVTLRLSSPLRGWRLLGAFGAIWDPPGAYISLAPLEPQGEAFERAV